jgi:microcystin-dependent protein
VQQIPAHSHPMLASTSNATQTTPSTNVVATPTAIDLYRAGTATTAMAAQAISSTGGSQPHTNFQPYLCINYIISLFGIFPTPT